LQLSNNIGFRCSHSTWCKICWFQKQYY